MWKSRVFSLAVVLACLFGFSCKVGLGEAVDTVPPTVTITYPPAGAVVRDAFVLAGDCDDDTGVSSVDIYYERTGTYATEKAMLATVNVGAGEKRWSLTINPNEQDVKDGPYVFYAVAKDTQGRTSGTYTQSFEVDNTAPVMILTKPTSFGSDNPKAYGRSISIEGTYAEATENRIDKLVVTFYNEDGTKVTGLSANDTTFNDITDMSNANPLIIAKLDTSGSADPLVQQRDNIYRKLYGTNDFTQGAKEFYFTVTAYDKARRYTDPSVSGGTDDGNATTNYYMGTNDLLNLINGEKDGYSAFSVKAIQELTSGLDNTYANNQQVQTWLSQARVLSAATSVSTPRNALDGAENLSDERKAKTLNFSMNPANYPTFTVSGLKIGSTGESYTEGYFNYYSGTPLNFAIMAGLDQTKIAVDSVSIYVAKVDDGVVDAANKQLVWTWNPTVAESLADDQEREEKYTPTRVGENADSVSKTVALDFNKYQGDMKIGGSKWKFIVEGHDISGDDKTIQDYDEDGYGFFASISEQAATITVDPNEDKATNTNLKINSVTKKYDSFIYYGDITSSGVTTMKYDLKITGSSSSTPLVDIKDQPFTSSEYPYGGDPSKWRININIPTPDKNYIEAHPDLYNAVLTIKATNGGGTSQQTRTFNIDNDEPAPTLISFKKGEQDVYLKDNVYYLKKAGTNATTYELYGTTIDNYMIDKTEIKLEGKDASGNAKVLTDPKYTSTWYFYPNFTGFAAQTGENNDVTVTISALDKAGNEVEGSITFKVEFDDAAPEAKHDVDASGKDVNFRIGDADNEVAELSAKGLSFDNNKDKNVGGKYKSGTWGNTTTMKIRGNIEDQGSGLDLIYYQVLQPGSTETPMSETNYESINTGYFAPLATPSTTKRVKKNGQSNSYDFVYPTTNFEAVLTGFVEGSNTLRLVSVDKVGNASLDQVVYSLNVDLVPPTVEADTNEAILTNGDNSSLGPITGTATDEGMAQNKASGIASVDFYVGNSNYKITSSDTTYGSFTLGDSDSNGVRSWTLTLNNSTKWIKNFTTDNINVYANVRDGAGLTTNAVKVATIKKDVARPTISIGDIKDAYTSTKDIEVNGTISFSGIASDNNDLSTTPPVLYYRTSNPGNAAITSTSGWTQIAAGNYTSLTGTSNWTCTGLNTKTAFGDVANGTSVWIMASIVDKAGNTGYSAAQKIIVDQNTDRPVITFTDLENKDSWLQKNEIRGSISDDDVQVADNDTFEFKIYIGDSCPSNWSGIDPVATKPGSWQLPESAVGSDGTKKIWFYVKQYAEVKNTAGKEFISSSGSAAGESRPYYKYSTTQNDDSDIYGNSANGAVTVKKDTTPPKFWTTLVTIGENPNAYDANSNPNGLKTIEEIRSGDWQSYALKSEKVIGGKKSHFKIYVPVYDEYVDTVTADIRDDNNDVETNRYYVNGGPKTEITLQNTNYHFEKDGLVYYYYFGEVIDVSKGNTANPPVTAPVSGVKSVKVTIKDQAGNSIDQTCSFTLDNKGPEVNLMSPKQTDVLTGEVDVQGTAIDGESFVKNTYWMIPDATQRNKTDAELANNDAGWLSNLAAGATATSWKFSFKDDYDLTHYDANNTGSDNDIYTLPLYIKSVDDVGNWTIKKFSLKHNPDADKPVTEISYPSAANYTAGNNFVTLGGTIRVTGSVSIPSLTTNPEKVYIQIASEDGDWLTTDKIKAENYGYTVKTVASVGTDIGKPVSGLSTPGAWWGIEATRSSNAWSFNLNATGSLNPTGAGANAIKIRACGVNENGKMGIWSDPVYIHIDASTPEYTTKLYQFDGTPAVGAQTVEQDYEPGIYVKGQWYLGLHITDDDKVVFENATLNKATLDSSKITKCFDNNDKTLDLFIKLDPNATVTQSYAISARDKAEPNYHYIYPSYDINIDNTAPDITAVYKGSTDVPANYLNTTSNSIYDTNYVYTLGGKVSENGSGFDRIAFYYVRANAIDGKTYTTEAVLDPLATSDSKVAISGLTRRSYTQGSSNYYMYTKSVSGTLGADGYTFTSADIVGNPHIRAGGLIEVKGLLRRIVSISSNTVTFDTNCGVTTNTSATAYFPYAQVVDNTSMEKVASESANPFTFQNNTDDGDKMPESLTGSKSMGFTWDATVHSYNMPDGPASLVVLAFDKAGNVSGEVYPVMIENSAPRLAKVFLGTDLNSSSTWDANEFVGYDIYNANVDNGIATTEVKAAQAISTANYGAPFTIKDKLAVVAEFVGGNGDIKMVYGRGATTTAPVPSSGTGAGITATANNSLASVVLADKIGSVNYNNATVSTSLKGYTLVNNQIVATVNEANDGTGKKASFTFWDSTDELTSGVDTQNCVLLVNDFTIDLVDSVSPHVVVNPFYWSSDSENSLYGNSSDNGHIEFEGNLTGTPAATLYGTDPKVSGKITFTGTAYDEHSLKSLAFSLTNSSGTALTGFNNVTMATYSPTTAAYSANGGWSALSGNSGATLANGGKYEWTISQDNTGGEGSAGYYEDTYYLGQAGHKIYWTISIDSSQIPNVAAENIKLTVTSYDGNTYSTAATSTGTIPASDKLDAKINHVPSYQFDVVPYITGLNRNTTLTDTHRSRLGKYQVVLGEDVTISGFNLPGTATNAIKLQLTGQQDKQNGTVKTQITAKAGSTKDSMIFTVPATSGYIRVVTSTISSINNYNTGNEMESEYATDEWTDDVYLNVWKNDEYFYFSNDPISPAMDRIPNGNGQYRLYGGWATNGSKFFASYPNTSGSGNTGNAPNPANSGGTGFANGQSFGDPATFYDVIIDGNGNRYNMLLDCWQGNTDGWGQNFVVNRNGYYNHNNAGSGNAVASVTAADANYIHVIERMGNKVSPDNANSSDGYDEMFNQFLNPRLALYDGVAYLSYYDRYAKCLKYAALKPINSKDNIEFKYSTEGMRNGGGNNNAGTFRKDGYTSGDCVVAGYDTLQSGGSKTNLDVGRWSAVAVDTTQKAPVIVYYDSTNKRLMLATANGNGNGTMTNHSTVAQKTSYPLNSNSPVLTGTSASTTEGDAWNRQEVKTTDADSLLRLGQYVSMVTDAGGNLHIACNGAKGGNKLYYIYGAKKNNTYGSYDFTITCVDAEGAGTWTDIQLEVPTASGAAAKPVISYYDPSNDSSENAVKVAYLEGGVWDTMAAPLAANAVPDRITLALDVTDGVTYTANGTTNNSKLAIGYVSSRFDCVYLRKE